MSVLSITIAPRTAADATRLAAGLQRLTSEDPTLEVRSGQGEREVVIGAMSEWQLELAIDRLRREFSVNAGVGRPEVVYVEAVTQIAEAEMKHVSRNGGEEYAHVKVRVGPGNGNLGPIFENHVLANAIPAEFIPSIEAGIREALSQGIVAGYPIQNARVVLYDGSYHDVDSTPAAFRMAAFLATRDALAAARSIVLEPVVRLGLDLPPECVDAVLAELAARRGRVQSHDSGGETHHVRALAPLAQLFGLKSRIHEMTRGRGACDGDFAGYVPLPAAEDPGGDRDSVVGAPRKPAPTPRRSSIALPEPEDFDLLP